MFGRKRMFLLWVANEFGGKRVLIIVGCKSFGFGRERVFGPGRQKSLFNPGWQRNVWQKEAKITFCQMQQKFGRKRSCSRFALLLKLQKNSISLKLFNDVQTESFAHEVKMYKLHFCLFKMENWCQKYCLISFNCQ